MPKDRLRALARRYQLQAPLGEGGMGLVWRAWDELLHQPVAIKEVALPAHLPAQERERRLRRTLREARTAARLRSHPGIVTVYDVVEEDGLPWIVMELVDGPSLAEVIKREGRLPEARAAELGRQVISALAAAEVAGVVHRDVKPANILLKNGRAMLTDFGIAAASHDTSELTAPGQMMGTPAYLAPEQIEGRGASAASDLWAVGVTLYQAVEGRRPFERDSAAALIAAIISRPPDPPRYADLIRPVLDGLLVKDPAGRLTADQAMTLLAPAAAGTRTAPGRSPRHPGTGNGGPGGAAPGPADAHHDGADGGPGLAAPGLAHDGPGGAVPGLANGGAVFGSADGGAVPASAGGRHGGAVPGPVPGGTPPTAGGAPSHPPTGPGPSAGSPRGRVAVAAGSVLAAAAVTAAVIWGVQHAGAGSSPEVTPSAGSSAQRTPAGSGAPSNETASSNDTASSNETAPSSGRDTDSSSQAPDALPRGFTLHTDRRGFSIAVPDGWTKEESGNQVSWERGGSILSPSWYLGAFADPARKETRSPAAMLDELRTVLQDDQKLIDPASYRELSRKEVPYPGGRAAELEFRFSHPSGAGGAFRFHARCLVRDSGGVGLFWFFTPEAQWAEAGTHVDTLDRTFRLN
ncbi:protein kinase [Planobispora siamensis]|nr:serine/threonine-protein kinase [Planobispora siamensis]